MFCSHCGSNNFADARFCSQCGSGLAMAPLTAAVAMTSTPVRHAGFWFRVLAVMIDAILCQLATLAIVFPIAFVTGAALANSATESELEAIGGAIGFILGIVIQWLWFTIPESSAWQASIGKKMLGLKVTDENGARIGFGRANGRYWAKILSAVILGIGFLMVAFTRNKQGLHDQIADTLVIRGR